MVSNDFEYNNSMLSDYGFIMVNPDSTDQWGFSKTIVKGEVNQYKTIANHLGSYFDSVLVLSFSIIKEVCVTDPEDIYYDDVRNIMRWLTSAKLPKSLYIHSDNNTITEYIGLFTSVEPMEFKGLYGFNLTFTCNSPYAFQNDIMRGQSGKVLRYMCDSDELEEYLYPVITIEPYANGYFKIENTTTGDVIELQPKTSFTKIMIDGEKKRLLGDGHPQSFTEIGLDIGNILDYNGVDTGFYTVPWIRVAPGLNEFNFTGNAKFEVRCRIPIKIGGAAYVPI